MELAVSMVVGVRLHVCAFCNSAQFKSKSSHRNALPTKQLKQKRKEGHLASFILALLPASTCHMPPNQARMRGPAAPSPVRVPPGPGPRPQRACLQTPNASRGRGLGGSLNFAPWPSTRWRRGCSVEEVMSGAGEGPEQDFEACTCRCAVIAIGGGVYTWEGGFPSGPNQTEPDLYEHGGGRPWPY